MSDPNYAYPYPSHQGYCQAPPVMDAPEVPVMGAPHVLVIKAPPFDPTPTPPPRRRPWLFDSCLAVFCCFGRCCSDPNNLPADGSSVSICDPNKWFCCIGHCCCDPSNLPADGSSVSICDPSTCFA